MKKSLIAAIVLASASFGSSAVMAQDVIGNSPQALNLIDNSAFFGDTFEADNQGNTFADRFTFTVDGDMGMNLDAIISSISRSADEGLDITGLALYGEDDTLITNGTSLMSGEMDVWSISSDNLMAGNYYLQVSGTLVSDTGGSFGGAVMLAPVPEPETYGMMLGGLGVLGFLARRRKAKQA
ncbi:FxDxF family PEP-CTERM protein [Massilia sp. G4R7]|uniref:FxDxF family PEP-CTERM protein n=1 Tax=Massilia phyllostachyos TaxID=2898585 RepID=A0ABS8Q3U2_9BURK|nr:FxDxF family PEP-CTERM protein [Massilia phyllostachyos]MCD2516413.1 FxDxF family PEP-CTERM protein [Massilia phyllostachyos]